jgi:hypothetical protein
MIITRNSSRIAIDPDLTKARIAELASLQDGWCLTLQLPLRHHGREARQAGILLKELDVRARRELALRSASPREIETLMEPVETLLESPELPHLKGEGLALFSSRGGVACYLLPDPPEPMAEVDHVFRVDGLVPALVEEEPFLLLSLDLHAARLWEGNRLFLREIPLNGLHVRPPHTPVFGKHDAEDYCRRVDQAVRERLRGCKLPLLLAGAYPLHTIFRKVSDHPRLVDIPSGGLERGAPADALHDRAWASLKALRRAETRALLEEFGQGLSSWRTASGITDVLPCSYDGSVSHLLLRKGYEVWGFFDPDTGKVTVDPARMAGSRNLVSLACLNTLLDGGRVHVVEPGELPEGIDVAAICRY